MLADVPTGDVIRHHLPRPDVAAPADANLSEMPMIGRELRLVDVVDVNSPDEVGPPELYAWLHYDPIPARDDLAKALVAYFTGHLGISTTMRAHAGIGTSQAHLTVSTAPMSISVAFHEPVRWDGWLLYTHESTQVGAGMSYVRGAVHTEEGELLALLRAGGADPSAAHHRHVDRRPLRGSDAGAMYFTITHPMHSHPYNPELVSGEGIATVAAAAEAAGIHGFGFTDHPAPSQRWLEAGGHDALDPFVALGFAAASTTTLRLIPNIVVLPYRNPFVVAKSGATLDLLSGGRFTLAVGVGYLKREFAALGVSYDERAELFDEALQVIRTVWTGDDISFEGKHFSATRHHGAPAADQQPASADLDRRQYHDGPAARRALR